MVVAGRIAARIGARGGGSCPGRRGHLHDTRSHGHGRGLQVGLWTVLAGSWAFLPLNNVWRSTEHIGIERWRKEGEWWGKRTWGSACSWGRRWDTYKEKKIQMRNAYNTYFPYSVFRLPAHMSTWRCWGW